ncbi:serine hydrolase [Streptomyces himastatinicus]|uniref:serine hydrolase n=1 Tax=Streptomyces himastatinicus TaxID=998084 RepID=UPI0001B4B8DE|nr:serine hydrolase [Streptomyces himastatinicus]
MTRQRIRPRPRAALSVALAAGLLAPALAGAETATAETPRTAATPRAVCTSDRAGQAAELSRDIGAALHGRSATTAVSLRVPATHTRCTLRADRTFDSASVVKVTVLATLLWDAEKHDRELTRRETRLATAMITKSDNDATSALWRQLKAARVKAFLRAAGMTRTVPGSGGYWGLTQITANDEEKLLERVTRPNAVLDEDARAYIRKLMHDVVPSQRWGTPAGAPRGTTIQVKNGWLSRATHGWRVHSIGAFTGRGQDYTLTVLTQDNARMKDGVAAIQAVARAVHKDLNPTAGTATPYTPPLAPQEAMPAVP